MARYRIAKEESSVCVDLTDVGGKHAELLEAFGECQAGRCSCPTDEYQKLASMEVQQAGNVIRLRLKARRGEELDTSEIAACLDYVTTKLTGPRSEG